MSDDAAGPEEGAPRDKVIEPLRPSTTRTESAGPDTSTPLVYEGSDEHERAAGPGGPSLTELKGEVKSLRSRNQILRTERTAMAGRKYALETVVESLREKLEHVAELCATLDAPGELGEELNRIRELVGDARRIATDKSVFEADLEAERAAHLKKLQDLETKLSELSERAAGDRAERDALRERTGELDRDRARLQQQVAELERFKDEAAQALDETVASEEERHQRIEAAEGEARELRERLETAERKVRERTEKLDAVEQEARDHRGRVEVAQQELREAQAKLEEAERRAEEHRAARAEAEGRSATVETELDEAKAEAEALRQKNERKSSTIGELRDALGQIKPVFDELDRENKRLSRLVGEARERGRVDVQELIAREQLLRKLDRLMVKTDRTETRTTKRPS